jgi:hypothetical protein
MSQQINLFSPVFLRQEKYFSAKTMLQAFVLILVCLAAFYGYARYQSKSVERVGGEVAGQLQRDRAQLAQFVAQSQGQEGNLLRTELARLETAVKARRSMLGSLRAGEFGGAEGFAQYFAAFARQALPGVWLTGFSLSSGGNALVVNGRVLSAELVPAYPKALNNEAVMRGRKVVELKLSAKVAAAAPKAATQGAAGAPTRYVEFTVVAPRVLEQASAGTARAAGRRR